MAERKHFCISADGDNAGLDESQFGLMRMALPLLKM